MFSNSTGIHDLFMHIFSSVRALILYVAEIRVL